MTIHPGGQPDGEYDVIIIGGGVIGALIAQKLTAQYKRVLILEAGRAVGSTFPSYQSYVENFYASIPKTPNAPYPQNLKAPSPLAIDVHNITPGTPDLSDYTVETGPLPFGSTYQRALGGTTLHWMGFCPRMVPNDFNLQSVYGRGVDWPIDYDDIKDYYCDAEWAIGVAGNKADQERFGITFPDDYDYPMERIPLSWSDQQLQRYIDGEVVIDGAEHPVEISSLPHARNSIPRPLAARGGRAKQNGSYQPVPAVGTQNTGERCEGNASCIPICPVQAKYSALKTLNQLPEERHTLLTQAVATELLVGENGRINGVVYKQYPNESALDFMVAPVTVKATLYVLAAHAVENAKLLLASGANGIANSSDQVGRNLMDHPFFITWALAPRHLNLGQWRGPGATSEIPNFRDGAFRRERAATRIDVGNWGWDVATFPPDSNINAFVYGQHLYGPALRHLIADELPRQLRIGYVLEQLPESTNRVTIDRHYMGPLGTYRPVLHYDISDYTRAGMAFAWKLSDAIFDKIGIPQDQIFTQFDENSTGYMPYTPPGGTPMSLAYIGSGHHIGTHRMGVQKSDSVVNRNMRSWDHENLYIVGCGAFPTSATSNPTLTASALALMAADDMLKQLG